MGKKTVRLRLYLSELIYNIESVTHLTADSKHDRTPEQLATMKAGDDDIGRNALLRYIGNAYASLCIGLSEYIEESRQSSDNIQQEDTEYLELVINRLPSNYNEATTQGLASAAHQYIVNTALMEWFMVTSPSDAGDYAKLSERNLVELRTAIHKRVRPSRPKVNKS